MTSPGSLSMKTGKLFIIAIIISFSLSLFFTAPLSASPSRAIKVSVKDKGGNIIELYSGSYALLIGVSDYTAGWPDLESIPGELDKVEKALTEKNFKVERIVNPTSGELKSAYETFINKYGFDEENRLLFFYSGHGHSRKSGKKGYLVPADAPDPRTDEKGFVRKSLGMSQILTWSRRIEAKHALFFFDSCFSGTIFKTKALPKFPPHISSAVKEPVRQFITAGSSGEEVPANSVFVPTFLRAIKGKGDLDGDGYVTGTEVGMYIHNKVMSYETGQTPQYGKIKDPDLDEGDFVFVVSQGASSGGSIYQSTPVAMSGGADTESLILAEKNRLKDQRQALRSQRIKQNRQNKKQILAFANNKTNIQPTDLFGTVWKIENLETGYTSYKKFRKDGLMGHSDSPNNFKFSRRFTWSIKRGHLVLNNNRGFSIERFKLPANMEKNIDGVKTSKKFKKLKKVKLTLVK